MTSNINSGPSEKPLTTDLYINPHEGEDIGSDKDVSGKNISGKNMSDNTMSGMEIAPHVTKSYIVDMLEQLHLLAKGSNLRHLASGMDTLLEPYRD